MKRMQGEASGHRAVGTGLNGQGANVVPLHNAARDFIVLTTQRTGSSWLMDRLNNLPGVEGHMELFYHSPRREPARAGRNDYPRYVESRETTARGRRPLSVFRYLGGLYGRRAATGFKLMYSQLRGHPEVLAYVAARRLPVVHLVRNNHLDVLISEEIASVTGRSHNTIKEAGAQSRPTTVCLDPERMIDGIRRLQRKQQAMRRVIRLLPVPTCEISYETLCDDPSAFERLCRFLHVDPALHAAESKLVKRQKASHAEVIENYEEVRRALEKEGRADLLK